MTLASLNGTAAQRLAVDAQSLESLKQQARTDPNGAIKQAAQQFEMVFLNMLMKSMRDATPKDGLFDSQATEMYAGMLDQQWVQQLSKKGIGIADVMSRQLQRQQAGGLQGVSNTNTVLPASLRPETSTLPSTLDKIRQTQGTTKPAVKTDTNSFEPAQSLKNQSPATEGATQGSKVRENHPGKPFVQRLWHEAKQAEQLTGIPAQFMLGQAALESGWGRKEIKTSDGASSHNLFGIKAGPGWTGKVVEAMTTEYVNGKPQRVLQKFRAYDSYAEGFADYARLLSTNPRYAQTLAVAHDPNRFAAGLQRAGYATDPQYAEKLSRVIQQTTRMLV